LANPQHTLLHCKKDMSEVKKNIIILLLWLIIRKEGFFGGQVLIYFFPYHIKGSMHRFLIYIGYIESNEPQRHHHGTCHYRVDHHHYTKATKIEMDKS